MTLAVRARACRIRCDPVPTPRSPTWHGYPDEVHDVALVLRVELARKASLLEHVAVDVIARRREVAVREGGGGASREDRGGEPRPSRHRWGAGERQGRHRKIEGEG